MLICNLTFELEIDECENNNCSVHATCIDKVNGFECVCNTGYEGIGTSCSGLQIPLLFFNYN